MITIYRKTSTFIFNDRENFKKLLFISQSYNFPQVMVNSYLEARPDVNVILLDWSNMAHGSYLLNAARNTKKVTYNAQNIILIQYNVNLTNVVFCRLE